MKVESMRVGGVVSAVLVLMLLNPGRVEADEIYKWVDAQGNVHFVDSPEKIPARYREKSEHRKMEAPVTGGSQEVDKPTAARPARSSANSNKGMESYCRQGLDGDLPACVRACVNPKNVQAKRDCAQAKQDRRQAENAAWKEREEKKRVERRTRCLQRAMNRGEAAECVQRSLPPPTGKVKVVNP